jgi:dTDP-4-dehydrorhamnose 3,5-epimerase
VRFAPTGIDGVWIVEPEPVVDERGSFTRTFDRESFAERGLATAWELTAISENRRAGTLRGVHFQHPPHAESKLVRCARGRLIDVVVDLRAGSATMLQWRAIELDDTSMRSLYVPPGCAHGFLTFEDHTAVHYAIDAPFVAEAADGVRWDDPALGIDWPAPPRVVSGRDASYSDIAGRLTDGLVVG